MKCCPNAIEGAGSTEYGVVIVGHMPAMEERKQGKPFVGPNGSLLDAELEYSGWSRDKVYCTNILCQPFKPIKGDKRTLLEQHPECVARFERELAALNPKLVITLGTDACQYMTGMKVMKARGVPVFNRVRGYYVMPTLQPIGAIQGDSSVTRHVIRDLRKIPRILSWPQDGSILNVSFEVIDTPTEAQTWLSALPLDRIVTLDIETDNRFVNVIDIFTDKLLCVGVGYVGDDGIEVIRVMPATILPGLMWPNAQYTYQNAGFDKNGMLHYLGVELPIADDTMMMSYALDERGGRDEQHDSYGGIHGLGPQADEYCGAEFYKDRMKGQRGEHPAKLPTDVLYEYNANDVAYTLRLPYIYIPAMHADNVYDLYRDVLCH
jgi:uracil-DNA glycosylase family 4